MNAILFLGRQHGVTALQRLIEVCNIKKVFVFEEGVHEERHSGSIVEICKLRNIPFAYWSHGTSLEDVGEIDFIIAIKWRFLFEKSLREKAKQGAFVIHDSLLPAYRGASPLNWALINGESKVGATLFRADDGIDSGPILSQRAFNVSPEEVFSDIEKKMVEVYADLVEDFITRIANRSFECIEQIEDDATYCCRRTPLDGRVVWTKPAIEIFNLYRGLHCPSLSAFTYLDGKKVRLIECSLPRRQLKYVGAVPGRVASVRRSSGEVDIITGDGLITLHRVAIDDEVMVASELLKSITLTLD